MTCPTPCEGHTSRQGKDCMCSLNASRAALGLPPLHRDLVQEIGGEEVDTALYTSDSVGAGLWLLIVSAGSWIVAALLAILATYVPLPF